MHSEIVLCLCISSTRFGINIGVSRTYDSLKMSRFVSVFRQSVSFHSTHMAFLFALLLATIGCTLAVGTTPTMVGSPALMTTNGGTYPRSTRLSSGQLLGIYTHISGGTNTLVTCQSTDNGATWSDIGSVASGVGDIDNGYLLELPTTASGASQKRILAAFRNHSKDTAGNYTYYRIVSIRCLNLLIFISDHLYT